MKTLYRIYHIVEAFAYKLSKRRLLSKRPVRHQQRLTRINLTVALTHILLMIFVCINVQNGEKILQNFTALKFNLAPPLKIENLTH